MSNNLRDGNYTITSLVAGEPKLGVNYTIPALQQVNINAPVTKWTVKKVEGKEDQYLLGVGGYPYTDSLDKGVFAFIDSEKSVAWYITYQETQDAYTIGIRDAGTGWTVALPDKDDSSPVLPVGISVIIATRSIPPQYLPTQLFKFNSTD
ncbi:hypothetical protein PAXINDRAFT_6521 [Paxillus involutus ATCC 200175]|nr:hypothetical protein PAXINDRAFT_6521 [Paxillus involutus ATCC 200175]